MSATPSEKELIKQWNDYYTKHPEADLRGGGH
jgi:hypothetical protein